MIQLKNVILRRGVNLVLDRVNLTIYSGEKVGVVGRNGSGKSSLLALLRGELQPELGDVSVPASLAVAFVEQQAYLGQTQAIEHVVDGDVRLRRVQAAIGDAQQANDGRRLAQLHAEFAVLDGYTADARAASLMHGLGFKQDDLTRPVDQFSGGWQMRLNLARALMCHSDLLLLDEPTNHLDLDAVIWLERWLRRYTGTLLLISHDRDVLDGVVDHIVHLRHHTARKYRGSYSDFERQLAADLARQSALLDKQQREVKRIRAFVDRFRAQANKARQAQSRLKTLARMDQIAAAHVDAPFRFSFPAPNALPNPVIALEEVEVGYDAHAVLSGLSLSIRAGMRIALLGPNGAGKSTLLKILAGVLDPRRGRRVAGKGLHIGYFAQHQLEQLDDDATPLDHFQRLFGSATEQQVRQFLGGFDFSGDRVNTRCAVFSGGERARLVLATLIWQGPNLLLLDEPTNHLDLEMRHALSIALQEFSGALVLVSHDRHLITATTDELWVVDAGSLSRFAGDVGDYRGAMLDAVSIAAPRPSTADSVTYDERRQRRRDTAGQRERERPVRMRLERLETTLGRLTGERDALDARLADAAIYETSQKDALRECHFDRARVSLQIEEIESEWLSLSEQLDAMRPD